MKKLHILISNKKLLLFIILIVFTGCRSENVKYFYDNESLITRTATAIENTGNIIMISAVGYDGCDNIRVLNYNYVSVNSKAKNICLNRPVTSEEDTIRNLGVDAHSYQTLTSLLDSTGILRAGSDSSSTWIYFNGEGGEGYYTRRDSLAPTKNVGRTNPIHIKDKWYWEGED